MKISTFIIYFHSYETTLETNNNDDDEDEYKKKLN